MTELDKIMTSGQIATALLVIAFALLYMIGKKPDQKSSKTVEHKLRK